MKQLVIKQIIKLNKKYVKFDLGTTKEATLFLNQMTDKFIFETYDMLARYDEFELFKKDLRKRGIY